MSSKLSALPSFTPVLTDLIYGVDDPSGTPASGKLTLTSVLALFTANTDADDINDTSTTNKFATAGQLAKVDFLTVTQAVDLDAIETRVNALDAAVVLKGTWDASSGSFPGGGTAQAGDSWIVSVGGTVNSITFAANDRIIAITDNASTATFAANWHKADYSDEVVSVVGLTGTISKASLLTALNVEDGATADQTGAEIEASLDTELANTRWKAIEVPAGGTTGQVLKKIDGTDYNYSWQADSGGGGGISWSDAVNADIIPDADGTRDLGSVTTRFAELHVDTIDLNGTTFSGATIADPGQDGILTWDDSATAGTEAGFGTYGQGLSQSGRNPQVSDNVMTDSITFVIDGGGSAITTGIKGTLEVPYACTIQQVTMLADQTGSIVVDIWKDTYANYPPVDADSITASAVPTISAAVKSQDATLTGWTTSVAAGDILRFNVDSASTITRVTIALKVKKT